MGRPRKGEEIDIRPRAIEATMRLLDRRDASAITLTEVAEAIGCRAPALYGHFANKSALLRAVHDEGFRILLEEKLTIAARHGADGPARLEAGGRAYLRFAFERPGLYRLMFAPPPATGLPEDAFTGDPGLRCLAVLRDAIVACRADGWMVDTDPDAVALTLWSAVHGAASLALQNRLPTPRGSDPEAALAVVETMMAFIRATRPRDAAHPTE